MRKGIKYKRADLIGRSYNLLTILNVVFEKNKRRIAVVFCGGCGRTKKMGLSNVVTGLRKSCGCLSKNSRYSHGLSKHPLYNKWNAMISRCKNKRMENYKDYGACGVMVCKEWQDSPKAFIDWALANGWKPGLQIDKDIIPKRLGIPAILYSPEMCCFVTPGENCRGRSNTRILEFRGERKYLSEWAVELNTTRTTLAKRLEQGWSVERILTTPIIARRRL